MSAHIVRGNSPLNPGAGGVAYIVYATAPTGTLDLSCYMTAFEITSDTEDIDVGVMCNASLTDQGITKYTAVASLLWEPALYTAVAPHIGQVGKFKYSTDLPDGTRTIEFNTRFVAQPWGRFEIGQRVEVDLPLAVLETPVWLDIP